ncbi:hypothetical protein [Roseivirga misakiensis]|nr:hypothetical protein [Roseivirga misakiensis]
MSYQKPKEFTIKNDVNRNLNLSEIATSLEMIILDSPAKGKIEDISEFILTSEFIFTLTRLRIESKDFTRVLQFNKKGGFIQQVGEDFKGGRNLVHNPTKEAIGISDGKEVVFYNYDGLRTGVAKAFAVRQVYFNDLFWGVSSIYSSNQWQYTLKKSDVNGVKFEEIFKFSDPDRNIIGPQVSLSIRKGRLYFWEMYKKSFYEVRGNEVIEKFKLSSSPKIGFHSNAQIKGDWIVVSGINQIRRKQFLKLINIKSEVQYSVPYHAREASGILDDISGAGFLNVFPSGPVYGEVANKLFFVEKKKDVPSLSDSQYPEDSLVIFIATLK